MLQRSILAFVLLGVVLARPALSACPSEAQYPNKVVSQEGDLRFVVGTDAAGYDVGCPVQIYLGAENTGTGPQVIDNPASITPMNAAIVMPGSCLSVNPTCWDNRLFWSPEGVFFFGTPITLDPGECVEVVVTWDGILRAPHPDAGGLPTPGLYSVMAGYFNFSFPYEFHAPTGGLRVPITINGPVPVEPLTWGSIKLRHRMS